MEIIDAQIHEPVPGIPFDDSVSPDLKTLINVELAREAIDCVRVDKALVFARQEFNDACVARYPELFKGCTVLDHTADDLEEQIATFRSKPGMLAVRCLIGNYRAIRLNPRLPLELVPEFHGGGFDRYWAYAEKYDVPMFFSAHDFAGELALAAERHPGLTIVVDHFGITQSLPFKRPGSQWTALPRLLELARYPNVYVKCCGTPVVSDAPYPFEDAWPHIHKVLKAFGPERCMWASDFTRMRWGVPFRPGTSGTGIPPRNDWKSYADALFYILHSNEISQSDKEQLFSGAVRRAMRWYD